MTETGIIILSVVTVIFVSFFTALLGFMYFVLVRFDGLRADNKVFQTKIGEQISSLEKTIIDKVVERVDIEISKQTMKHFQQTNSLLNEYKIEHNKVVERHNQVIQDFDQKLIKHQTRTYQDLDILNKNQQKFAFDLSAIHNNLNWLKQNKQDKPESIKSTTK